MIRLQRQIPLKVALEIALSGEPVSAARALELGLANRAAGQGKALETALDLAEVVAANAPLPVQRSKRVVHSTYGAGPDWGTDV